jgi:hypothetical protein
MNRRHFSGFPAALLLVSSVGAAAIAVLWFLVLAIRSFYPIQAGVGIARVDGGLLLQGGLALLCLGVVVVLLGGAWSTRRRGARGAAWFAGALGLAAVLVVLALSTERFIHPVAWPYSESSPVYSGEAGLWTTYFWVATVAVLATAVLLLLARLTRR